MRKVPVTLKLSVDDLDILIRLVERRGSYMKYSLALPYGAKSNKAKKREWLKQCESLHAELRIARATLLQDDD